ncbi:MAG TPA: DUF5977 domain-containing protein [Chitinophaga sp.]|uniref:DUF5977 domain-containing protein n=1 Tax=Chitinophaga sp. TaxID=1869181 RepID=UPI002B68250D|nr:DUF5977 domain-containing protein [Chitinophaga sp.]HVI46755.1 DUF5977 domain-containing protein [Chitinophaga sp.]
MFSTRISVAVLCQMLIQLFITSQARSQKIEFSNALTVLTDRQTPVAAGIEKFGNIQMSYQSGSPNISIPIYEIELKGFRYPIALSYTAKGMPVRSVAGTVGLGWNLNAVTNITFQRFGSNDYTLVTNNADAPGYRKYFQLSNCGSVCGGYCTYTNSQDVGTAKLMANMQEFSNYLPDIYTASGPTLNKKFFLKDKKGFTIPASDLRILSDIQTGSGGEEDITSGGFTVTDTDGNVYFFNKFWGKAAYLTKIITAANDSIKFYYNAIDLQYLTEGRRMKIEYEGQVGGCVGYISWPPEDNRPNGDRYKELLLDSIVAGNKGKIEFSYSDRKDLIDTYSSGNTGKKLDQVKVYDHRYALRKQLQFTYSYFGDSTAPNGCYLKLTSVKKVIPGTTQSEDYKFGYNPMPLPGRLSLERDTIGYYTREPKACMLEKVTYPTGGYTQIEYERNRLWYKTPLRVRTITDYTLDGKQFNIRSYEYEEQLSFKKRFRFDKRMFNSSTYCQNSSAAIRRCFYTITTSECFTDLYDAYYYTNIEEGYPKVTEYFGTNSIQGKKEYYNLIPAVSNFVGLWNTSVLLSKELTYKKTDSGFELVSSSENTYNQFDNLKPGDLFADVNHPRITRTWGLAFSIRQEEINGFHSACGGGIGSICSPYDIEQVSIALNSVPVLLTSTVTKQYNGVNSTPLVTTLNYTYNDVQSLTAVSTTSINSKNENVIISKQFPYDFSGTAVYDSMQARNMKSYWVTETINHDSRQIFKTFRNYIFTDATLRNINTSNIQIQNGSSNVDTRLEYHRYDNRNNILEQSKTKDIHEVYLWGYGNQYPVARVVGASYDQVIPLVNQSIIQNPASDQQLRDEIQKLRDNSSGWQISGYTYLPLIGITSETAPDGRTTYYEYDGMGRLRLIRDIDGKILKLFCYNYLGQQTECTDQVFYNSEINRAFTRNNCSTGYDPLTVIYTVPKGKYGSLQSQQEADNLAEADVTANGQNYANANAACLYIYYNTAQSATYYKNDCQSGSGAAVVYTVPQGKYKAYSQQDADQLAINEMVTNGQQYANTNGSCLTYYVNDNMSQGFTRNNCSPGYIGGYVLYTVPKGKYTSTESVAKANEQAQADINANGQNYANQNGTCTCGQEGYKLINGNCELGTKEYFQEPQAGGKCKNGYFYRFSDGSTSPKYYTSVTAC